jgi:hypothetical protein
MELSLNIHLISPVGALCKKQEYPKTKSISANIIEATTVVHSLYLHYPVISVPTIINQYMIVSGTLGVHNLYAEFQSMLEVLLFGFPECEKD